ncbi:hypothetical protein MNEG_15575 [Monoraphidium neglectum]|uniref:Uncharacterized protein n=1 Tax=Monoraphidium neglectum TaxID=145388 RepID=A0A0D2LKA6_9CHLO|nr:hypothetical protein MNEG_15575 [Monoraphidium neglectum]KIY92389.1 hypothetical protein MNEG_15575 [Monoraphidium neglectum]|eukprot:XP_013891409.1 hypothetical protein MNEG_15575 [Monoraphidium neglectum]
MRCKNGTWKEVDSVWTTANAPGVQFEFACDLNGVQEGLEWANDAPQSADDPLYDTANFKQYYYLGYYPPMDWVDAYNVTYSYKLVYAGSPDSVVNVTCSGEWGAGPARP